MAAAGDSLFVCKKTDGALLIIIAQSGSTVENQLYWLFGLGDLNTEHFCSNTRFSSGEGGTRYAARMVLEQIGIEYEDSSVKPYVDDMLNKFAGGFPSTKEFSEYARSIVDNADPIGEPDATLVKWIDTETSLFKSMEQHLIKERIRKGFLNGDEVDVDDFIQFSLSVQNRRKSRAGLSLENHIEELLRANGIRYSHAQITENKTKPDFIFPDIRAYRDEQYDPVHLTMLGAKSTCKDRWRQVLAEADKIKNKHLLTLESSISESQTNEMEAKHLQLVLPLPIHETYTESQRKWLWSVQKFFKEVKERKADILSGVIL